MAKTKEQKKQIVESFSDKLSQNKALVFANFKGLTVKDIEELRKKCRQENVDYMVAKKTLMNIAFKKAKLDVDAKTLEGEVASVFGYDDETQPARIIEEFSKEHQALKNIGGILENKFVGAEEISELAKLPSKQELLAKVVGSVKAPISGFVNVLAGNMRGLVVALNAIKESKEA